MVDVQALKVRLWAQTGDRQDPEDVGLNRDRGWTVEYEQIDSGAEPERAVFNQLLRELSGWAVSRITEGIGVWDAMVDYTHPAFCSTDEGLYVSMESSGPRLGNPTDPDTPNQSVWRRY